MRRSLLRGTAAGRRWVTLPGDGVLRLGGALVLAALAVAALLASLLPQAHIAGRASTGFIATRSIPRGATIMADDIAETSTVLPAPARVLLAPRSTLVGARALVTIPRGALLERDLIARVAPRAAERTITIAVPDTAVAPSALAPGDRVDVVATTDAVPATTLTIGTQLLVTSVQSEGGEELITVSTPTLLESLAIAQALATDKVDVINATGVPNDWWLATYPSAAAAAATGTEG